MNIEKMRIAKLCLSELGITNRHEMLWFFIKLDTFNQLTMYSPSGKIFVASSFNDATYMFGLLDKMFDENVVLKILGKQHTDDLFAYDLYVNKKICTRLMKINEKSIYDEIEKTQKKMDLLHDCIC